jgi:hypothetical protein
MRRRKTAAEKTVDEVGDAVLTALQRLHQIRHLSRVGGNMYFAVGRSSFELRLRESPPIDYDAFG